MDKLRELILLTVLVMVGAIYAILELDTEKLSSYGSILSASAGILAVIWFTASLYYQAQQLKEQRTQFLTEFQQLQETSRRDSLLLARNILDSAEQRALNHHGEITSSAELVNIYLIFSELKPIMESEDPIEVQQACKVWMKKEGAATILIKGIKNATEVYFRSIGAKNIDYSKPPEEFVYIYGPSFWKQPFFEAYEATATMLCQFMIRLEPGRKAAVIASLAAIAKSGHDKLLNMDIVLEDIKKHLEKGYPLPKIAEGLVEN